MVLPSILLATLGAGALSHVLYFQHGEHHLHVTRYIKIFFASWIAGTGLYHALLASSRFSFSSEISWPQALLEWSVVCALYLAGLSLSIFTYRIFFNPLNKLPGPFSAQISDLSRTWWFRQGKMHEVITDLHSQYGKVVRLAPFDVSVTHAEAVNLIQGFGTGCGKGEGYDLHWPNTSLQAMRSKEQHTVRRRVWSQGFSDKAIRGYEMRIRKYQDQLVNAFLESKGQPIDAVKWAKFYGYDVMGDLAWGRSFSMLETGQKHDVVALLDKGAKAFSVLPPIWLVRVVKMLFPSALKDWLAFMAFVEKSLLDRMKSPPDIPDIMNALLAPFGKTTPTPKDMDLLVGDSQLIIIAGGDTSATTIVAILYLLAHNPEHLDKLRKEIGPLMAGDEYPNAEKLAASNHLAGVINEALRLYPPVPSQMVRQAPPEGITIAGQYFPGNTKIWVPQWTLGRDESIYPHAKEFIPERWYDEAKGLVKDRSAFAPFALGQFGCIGKPLAMASIRTTIARLVTTFDISFPPATVGRLDKKPGSEFEEGMLDYFIMGLGELNLCFDRR
ncbi:L-ornithine-N5-monooxygenase [Rhypophila decipiens]|uniref:L-ornithine-N5-monooxygenase n=1 Tax=Rhypophila decipiens TaxID=261697 RepID=A0AAN6XTI2_9PEZI|nr:L-ornithine-N5-monooxygenase [Rhypophila decipiens]